MKENEREYLEEFNNLIVDLIERYQDKLPAQEIGHALIMRSTSMLMTCAPSEAIGAGTAIASIQSGIANYIENHKCTCEYEDENRHIKDRKNV